MFWDRDFVVLCCLWRGMESCGEKWRTFVCANICSYFKVFSFSVQGEKMFLFFFLLGAMHFSSYPTSHQNPPKSYQNPLNPHNKKTNKTLQNITFLSSPYPTSLLPPYITKKYKNKNQKKYHNTKYIHPKHHIKT